MTRLDELFPDGKRQGESSTVFDDRHTVRRLDQMFGDRRSDLDATHRVSGRRALVAMVNDAAADAEPLAASAPVPQAKTSRRRRRFDVINIAAASLAVIALIAVAAVGGIQAATASPAEDALSALEANEKTIEGVEGALASSGAGLAEEVAAADARAETLRAALDAVRTAPDPADIPPGETEAPEDAGIIAIADVDALTAALAAIDDYRTDLAGFELPAMPESYSRAQIDVQSLSEVGSAIDSAQEYLTELDRATASMRAARADLDARTDALGAQLATFAATFPPAAEKTVDANPDADQELKDAVTAAAAAIAGSDLLTDAAPATLSAYRDAVVALVGDQVEVNRRRERERQEQERIEREREQADPPPSEPEPGEPTPPPTESGEPTPPPTDSVDGG